MMVASQIRAARLLLHMDQFEFSKATAIERSRLSLIENGHVEATEAQIASIRRVLRANENRVKAHLMEFIDIFNATRTPERHDHGKR